MSEVMETPALAEALALTDAVLETPRGVGRIGSIIGEPGTGKTHAGFYLADHQQGVRIECMEGASKRTLAWQIASAFGLPTEGSSDALRLRILQECEGRLIVMDEANHLTVKQLEWLRPLADVGGAGLLLIGTDLLERTFQLGRNVTLLAQFASRKGAKEIRFAPMDAIQVSAFVLEPRFGAVGKQIATAFHQGCKGYWRDAIGLADACARIMRVEETNALSQPIVKAARHAMARR